MATRKLQGLRLLQHQLQSVQLFQFHQVQSADPIPRSVSSFFALPEGHTRFLDLDASDSDVVIGGGEWVSRQAETPRNITPPALPGQVPKREIDTAGQMFGDAPAPSSESMPGSSTDPIPGVSGTPMACPSQPSAFAYALKRGPLISTVAPPAPVRVRVADPVRPPSPPLAQPEPFQKKQATVCFKNKKLQKKQ